MTPVLFFGHGFLALLVMSCALSGDDGLRERIVRVAGWTGVVMGIVTVLLRSDLAPWRGTAIEPGPAAVAGASIACAWGLTLALELGRDRWWVAAAVGVGATGLILFAGALWTVPALLFWVTMTAALGLCAARGDRWSWLLLAIGDAALVGVLLGSAGRGSWLLPATTVGASLIPLGIVIALRTGAVPFLGPTALIGTRVAATLPLWGGSGFVLLARLSPEAAGIPAAGALIVALSVVALSTARRSIDPRVIAVWPLALGLGLCLASPRAAEAAAVGAIVSLSAVVLWPEALDRGRLARAFVLSAGLPNVAFAALATAAADSFARVTARGDAIDTAAWVTTSGLLPITLGSGVALGALSLRTRTGDGYRPEATFMTWLLLGASALAGAVLGAGSVFAALGGTGAVGLFAVALTVAVFAALRTGSDATPVVATTDFVLQPSMHGLAPPRVVTPVLFWAVFVALSWLTIEGLRVGFL